MRKDDRITAPDSETGRLSAEAFVDLLGSGPVSRFVANLQTRMSEVAVGEITLPCSVNDGTPTCYVCCPSTAYVDYARTELKMLGAPWIVEAAAAPLLWLARFLVETAGLDRQVQPNNWLIATNPAPTLGDGDLRELVERLVGSHPDHVVFWRSLDAYSDAGLMAHMKAQGWVLLPARMVYLFDCRNGVPKMGRDETRDRAILSASSYDIVDGADFDASDFARAAALYGLLYLDKYTPLNPHYTDAFLAGLCRAGLLEMKGLRRPDGILDGIIGFFDGDHVMTAPVVGYDTTLPQAVGLYRMLMAIAFGRARSRRMLFNASAGADSFKRNRGAVAAIEYSAVYNRHRPAYKRGALQVFAALLNHIALPVAARYLA